jgi:hypothetical protein
MGFSSGSERTFNIMNRSHILEDGRSRSARLENSIQRSNSAIIRARFAVCGEHHYFPGLGRMRNRRGRVGKMVRSPPQENAMS